MLSGSLLHLIVELIQKLNPLGSQERQEGERSFLQFAIRKQRVGNFDFMCVHHAASETLRAPGFGTQSVKLVQHFFGHGIERSNKCLVELRKRFAHAFHHVLDRLLTSVKARGKGLRQGFGFQFRAKKMAPGENVARVQIIFLEQICHVRWHKGKRCARQDCGRPGQQFPVNQRSLRVIGNFRGTANVRDRRQQRVLNHRPQESAGTELFRMLFHIANSFIH